MSIPKTDFLPLLQTADPADGVQISVYARILRDIQVMSDRLSASVTIGQLTQWLDGDRQRHADLIDVSLSVAETASLTSYRRPGEKWRLDVVGESSARGAALTAALHHLRGLLLDRTYLQSTIHHARIPDGLKEAIAILVLSLDAAPARYLRDLALIAGLGRTGDPQGDAQLRAEELFLRHEYPPLESGKPAQAAPADQQQGLFD